MELELSAEREKALAIVIDEIIPPSADGRLPGAGQVGVAAHVWRSLLKMPALAEMVAQGLDALAELAKSRGAERFTALARAAQLEVMNQLAASEHSFPPILALHVYAAYYQHPRVHELIGLDPRPPHPKGYEMEPDDLTLLDPVRRRPRMYRSV